MIKKSATVFGGIVGVFAVFFVTGAVFFSAPAQAYSLSVSAPTNTTISPQNGQTATAAAAIVVQTDCRAGYVLQIQGPTDTNLYLDGDVANNQAGKFISPVNASNPLNSQPNTYGYSLLSNSPAAKFLPLTNQLTTLKDLSDTASPTQDINDTTNLYWGAYAGAELAAGTYKMASSGAADYIVTTAPTCVNYNVNFDKNSATATGTMDPQPISVNIPTKLEPNQFTNTSAFLGWNTKPDGTGKSYTNEEEVLDLAPAEQSITLYAQWDTCLFNSVCYQGNGADAGLTMADQTTDATAATTTLWAPNFKRVGYGFVSWNTKPDGTGTDYGPNQTIDQTLTKDGLRLYAKWLQSDGIPLQNWGGCASLNIGDSVALTDTRDNDTYTVTKLADGNCWMTENLRLGGSSPISITTENTDSPTNFTLPASVSWFCSFGDAECAPEMDHLRLNASNTTATVAEMTSPDSNVYSYGNYYNWYAATAGTGTYLSGTMHNGVTAPNSICPKGWALPTGDNTNSGSFAYLNISFGGTSYPSQDNPTLSNVYRSYPNNFVFSGHFNSDHLSTRGEYARLSSATAQRGDENDINLLYLSSTYVYPGQINDYSSPGYDGYSIRCLTTDTKVSSYTVKFDANGGTGDMSPVNIVRDQSTALPANAFTAPDSQAFNKWTTAPDGSGASYTNEQLVNNLIPAGESITLYAQWGISLENAYAKAGKTQVTIGGNNYYRLQDITNDICNTATILDEGSQMQAIDIRDNNTYWITKLQDGKCWMTENLDLDLSTSTTLTPADTDLTSNWTPARSTANASNVTNNNIPGWNYDGNIPYSVDVGKVYWNGTDELAEFLNGNFGSTFQKDTPFATTGEHGAVGNYYNWPAAIAVNDASGYTDSTFEDITKNPQTSICPKGWRLPTISNQGNGEGSTSEFARLNRLYNRNSTKTSAGWVNEPLRAVRSGYLTGSGQHNAGNYIVYWSSTVSSTEGVAYNFRATPTAVYPTGYSPRAEGGSIRCVAREGYTVEFDANGGSGDMPNQAINIGVPTKLSANTFTTPEAWQVFLGWNTKPDGTGTSYTDEQNVNNLAAAGATITLYAQWGCPPGSICYDKNGATNSPTNMGRQSVGDSDTSALLWPSNFQRSGYGFAGWNTKADGTGTMYGPNETISDDATINNIKTDGLSLYATWIKSAGDIQGWDGCATMNIGDVTALTDKRDNQTYAVAKLADGKCWMTENLRLDNQYTTSAEDIALSQGYGTGFIGLAEPEFSNFDYSTVSNSLYSAADVGNNNTKMPRYNNINTANAVETLTSWTGTENIYSLGNYYTWTALVANLDTISYQNVSLSSTSICPAGWRLPRGGDKNNQANNDVWDLIVNHFNNGVPPSNYDNTDQPVYLNEGGELIKIMTKYPNNFVYSGRYENNSPNNRSTIGNFWTSTVRSEYGNAYNFGMVSFSESVNPGTSAPSRFTGMSARCVVDERYTVSFDANGGSGDMADQSIQVGIATKLSANAFTNSPKSFVGWNTKPDGTGDSYTNEQEVTDLVGKGETITLYAQWTEPTPLEQISTMQEMTSGICSATPVGTEAVLEDTRDGKTYSVAKLKDGNCWMTEDLDHDIDATKTYTPADTDISNNWTPDVSTINIQGLNVGENASGWVGAFGDNGLASADPGEVYWDGSTNRHSRIGNYYNWTAALAVNDSGAYSNGTETDPSQNPQTSICPKGWRLPIIANEITGHVDEFKELNRLYNNGVNSTDSGLIVSPLYFTRGGVIDQSSELQDVGGMGSYWSSTAGGPMYVFNTAYYFHHNAGGSDSYSSNIAFGHNIRCVARQSYTVSFDSNGGSGEMADQIIYTGIATKLDANTFTNTESFVGWNTKPDSSGTSYTDEQEVTDLAAAGETITLYAQWGTINPLEQIGLMQEMTPDICDAASIGDTATLKDIRDNKTYQVAKLADNNCWMTQNLMLGNGEGGTSIELTDIDTDLVTGTTFTLPAHTPGAWASSNTDADGANSAKMYNNGNIWLDPTSAGSNSTIKNADTPDNPSKYIGNYYNWYTATAGTGQYDTNTDAVSSICPKGWRLPIGGTTNNEFQTLASALGASGNAAGSWIMQFSPNYFALSGQYNYSGGGQISYLGARGFWWSSTPDSVSTYRASNLILTATSFNANQGTAKAQGLSVRCIAR